MLKHVDVCLGVALVMLGISLLITIVTQIVSTLLNLRGRALCEGLADLFATFANDKNLAPAALSGKARELAEKILSSRLISSGLPLVRLAPAIAKSDLLHLIEAQLVKVDGGFHESVLNAKKNIDDWFDATMGRISVRFTAATRFVTIVAAIVMAFSLHLNAFALVQRLSKDSELRAALVGSTSAMLRHAEAALPAPAPGETATPRLSTQIEELKQIQKDLEVGGFTLLPDSDPLHFADFLDFFGVVVSAALLSLGAPFWFNTLKSLSNLRPAVAQKADTR